MITRLLEAQIEKHLIVECIDRSNYWRFLL
jgi:hypothetical protein